MPQSENGASSHYHGYPNEWHGPKRKYDNSRRKGMGNHGGGIPKGAEAKSGTKGVSAGSADNGRSHGFHVGDHVSVHVKGTSVKGRILKTIGANHVHVTTKGQRRILAHVRNIRRIKVGRIGIGVH